MDLHAIAKEARNLALDMVYEAQSGHIGGSLSCTDIITSIYFHAFSEGDKFVLSKGHCSPALYAVLALKGYFDKSLLKKFRKIDGDLQGHPTLGSVPGIDMTTGSLGQGISAACGIAKAFKMDKNESFIYSLMGDGEQEEGQVWEAAMFASHYKLDNLIAIVDYNNLQIDGNVEDVMGIAPLDKKWEAFGWDVKIIDGHDFEEINKALDEAKANRNSKPKMIIAKTVKGKGVSFMENNYAWHGTAPKLEQYELAKKDLA